MVPDGHAREERVQVGRDDLLERHEALAVGHDDEAGQRRRHLDPGDAPLPRRRVLHLDHQVERQVGDVGERVAGVDGERGEDGVDLALEDLDEVLAVVVIEGGPVGEADAGLGQGGDDEVQEDVVLAPDELLDPAPDHGELLAGPQAVDRAGAHAGGDLVLQGGDPDLVELVEQLGEDGQELGPLHERQAVVLGQVEQAGAEVEPGLLPVREALVAEGLDLLVRRRGGVLDLGRRSRSADGTGPVALRDLGLGLRLGLVLGWVWVMGGGCRRRRVRGGMSPWTLPPTTTIRPCRPTRPAADALPALRLRPQAQAAHRIRPAALRLGLVVALYVIAVAGPEVEDPRQHRPVPRHRARAGAGRAHGQPLARPRRQRRHPPAGRAAQRHRLRGHRSLGRPGQAQGQAALGRPRRRALRRSRCSSCATRATSSATATCCSCSPASCWSRRCSSRPINGARLWVHFGSLEFQPIEFSKILLCIFFASYFAENKEMLSIPTAQIGNRLFLDPRPLMPILVAWGAAMAVIGLEDDIGFAALLFVLFIGMLWIATGRVGYLVLGLVLFGVGAYHRGALLRPGALPGRRSGRTRGRRRPNQPATPSCARRWYGMGTGGVGGTGLGLDHFAGHDPRADERHDLRRPSAPRWAWSARAAVVVAFVLLVGAGFRIAQTARSDFSRLMATGLTLIIGFQAFFIMAGVVRLLPFTGITLPSSPTAARRCWPTTSSSRCSCASPTRAPRRSGDARRRRGRQARASARWCRRASAAHRLRGLPLSCPASTRRPPRTTTARTPPRRGPPCGEGRSAPAWPWAKAGEATQAWNDSSSRQRVTTSH